MKRIINNTSFVARPKRINPVVKFSGGHKVRLTNILPENYNINELLCKTGKLDIRDTKLELACEKYLIFREPQFLNGFTFYNSKFCYMVSNELITRDRVRVIMHHGQFVHSASDLFNPINFDYDEYWKKMEIPNQLLFRSKNHLERHINASRYETIKDLKYTGYMCSINDMTIWTHWDIIHNPKVKK